MKRFLLTIFLTSLFSVSFLTGKVYAAAPSAIPPPKVPCPDINGSDPNFNSSRPYQASPCGDSPKAVMCGNSLQVIEDTPSRHAPLGTPFLDVNFEMGNKTYSADLSGATFPIAGNTELTQNSQNSADQIDDATKVNEYLNWYLNGVTNRAEYGSDKNTDYNIVNLSGPVQKLLPGAIQDATRIATINNLYKSASYASDQPQNPGDHPGPTALINDEAVTHDQIVVCASPSILGIAGLVVPHECYSGTGSPANPKAYRLSEWNGNISSIRTVTSAVRAFAGTVANNVNSVMSSIPIVGNVVNVVRDTAGNIISNVTSYVNGIPVVGKIITTSASAVVSNITTDAWNDRKPPLPWGTNPNTGKPFTQMEYQRAYMEWRGMSCAIVPVINKLFCIDNPLITNTWADLFPYIPLSNTVDKNAKNLITGVGINGLAGTEVSLPAIAYKIIQEPVLYFPHTAEVSELSNSLNQTYIPKEGTTDTAPSSSVEPINNPTTGKCQIVNLRSNPGDYLFPEVKPSEVNVFVNPYTVTRVPCHDVVSDFLGKSYALCQGQVAIEIRMVTKVPYADEIYNSTTAGADSTFRRIYPKVQTGAPVTCISNIPSVTSVKYTSTQNLDGMKVLGPLGDNTTDDPKLYFPHFGTVYDYFLKGIQTALRPKGYGEPTPESGKFCTPSVPTDCSAANVPDSAVPPKYLGAFKASFIDMANRTTLDCPGPQYNLATQCYNYVVSTSQKAGVNPAFTLAIWLNETGASNYCHSGPTTQDMGINLPSLYQNLPGQLEVFLKMANQKLCDGMAGFPEPMAGWLSRFQSSAGICDPTDATAMGYYEMIRDGTWTSLTNCVKNKKFGITWPTDMGCP